MSVTINTLTEKLEDIKGYLNRTLSENEFHKTEIHNGCIKIDNYRRNIEEIEKAIRTLNNVK